MRGVLRIVLKDCLRSPQNNGVDMDKRNSSVYRRLFDAPIEDCPQTDFINDFVPVSIINIIIIIVVVVVVIIIIIYAWFDLAKIWGSK